MDAKASSDESTSKEPEIARLEPRPLTQDEIKRLAKAQAYASRVTLGQEKLEDEPQDITSSIPSSPAEEHKVVEPEKPSTESEETMMPP